MTTSTAATVDDDTVAILNAWTLPWGGDRNLAMRDALGLEEGELCLINQGEVCQAVVDELGRANKLARRIKLALGTDSYTGVIQRKDGRYLLTAYFTQ